MDTHRVIEPVAHVRQYEVLLTNLTREGEAIGQVLAEVKEVGGTAPGSSDSHQESLPLTLSVLGGIPGERVIVSVEYPAPRQIKRKKRRRTHQPQVRLVRVLDSSSWRVEARCPHFGACGGCQFQHIAYERQLEIKREM